MIDCMKYQRKYQIQNFKHMTINTKKKNLNNKYQK